jgi:hypothetical protein
MDLVVKIRKRMKRLLVVPSIFLVLILLVIPSSVSAQQTHLIVGEFMFNWSPTAWDSIDISDLTVGLTPYGKGWDGHSNYVDLQGIWQFPDDIRIEIDITSIHTGNNGRWQHLFVLELYKESDWKNQGNPLKSDFVTYNYAKWQNGNNADVLVVTITAWEAFWNSKWLVMYQHECVDIDASAAPPHIAIAIQNFWIVI